SDLTGSVLQQGHDLVEQVAVGQEEEFFTQRLEDGRVLDLTAEFGPAPVADAFTVQAVAGGQGHGQVGEAFPVLSAGGGDPAECGPGEPDVATPATGLKGRVVEAGAKTASRSERSLLRARLGSAPGAASR